MNKFLSISLAVLGIGLAVVPTVSDCASQGRFMTSPMGMKMPMIDFGIRRPELALGAALFAVGAVMTFNLFKSKPALFSLAILAVLFGVGGILTPIINGTCANPTMPCNTIEKPALTIIGSLSIVGGLAGLVLARRGKS